VDLTGFCAEVGGPDDGPVTCVGAGTFGALGGQVDPAARMVRAPAGIAWIAPEEMTVCCGAGTPVEDLQAALAERAQLVALPAWGTVGGVLAVGRSGIERCGRGPVRDTLLQARVVTAAGREVRAGGPTVKNVSGYDLCRLLVGSLGTLAFFGEVILRTRPVAPVQRWFHAAEGADPFALSARLYRPLSLLWDGCAVWVGLEGHPGDVAAQVADHLSGFDEVDGPPPLPTGGRWSLRPSALRDLPASAAPGTFVAEVGVGIVHHCAPAPRRPVDPAIVRLHERLKAAFDPTGRLNPGRSPLSAA
jgi:glycolate oxidase FAD binding subunit